MIPYVLVYMSGDRRRVQEHTVTAGDIDTAAREGITLAETFGAGSSWFLVAVVQEDAQSEVTATLEDS